MKKITINIDETKRPPRKATISLRLDPETLRWFRKKKGFTSIMAGVLRAYMEASKR